MKTANLLTTFTVTLLLTSCAGLRQTVYFKADTECWVKKPPPDGKGFFHDFYSYRTDSANIHIRAKKEEKMLAIGPAPFPVIPMFMFFWTGLIWKNDPDRRLSEKLSMDVFFDINEPYGINPDAVRFVNGNRNMQPVKIEYISEDTVDLTDSGNTFRAEKPAHLRWYFEKEVKKVKQIDIHIESLAVNSVTVFLPPLKLKQKRCCEYNPLMAGHF